MDRPRDEPTPRTTPAARLRSPLARSLRLRPSGGATLTALLILLPSLLLTALFIPVATCVPPHLHDGFAVSPEAARAANGSGNATAGSSVTWVQNNAYGVSLRMYAWNGTLQLYGNVTLTSRPSSDDARVAVSVADSINPTHLDVNFGNGHFWSQTVSTNGSIVLTGTSYNYTTQGNVTLVIGGSDASQMANVSARVPINFLASNGTSGNGSGSNGSGSNGSGTNGSGSNGSGSNGSGSNGSGSNGSGANGSGSNGSGSNGSGSNGSGSNGSGSNGSGSNGSGSNGSGSNGTGGNSSVGSSIHLLEMNSSIVGYFVRAWDGNYSFSGIVVLLEGSRTINVSVYNLTVLGVVNPSRMTVFYGDGNSTNQTIPANGTSPVIGAPFHHPYATPGTYDLELRGSNANGSSVAAVRLWLNASYTQSSNHSAPYPTPVSVVVAASPVTGPAPLTTTFSAFIDGGSAPFVVVWSLPGSNASGNLSGLMVSVSYPHSGWFPATAFVYNTTNAYGSVLVGEGGVWIYAAGAGSGNGSGGNGSTNGSGFTPISGGKVPQGALSGALMNAGILAVVVAGAAVGGLGGFLAGRRTGGTRTYRAPRDDDNRESSGRL